MTSPPVTTPAAEYDVTVVPAKRTKENNNIRASCFTINNYTSDDVERLIKFAWSGVDELESKDIRFMVFGIETGEQGTRHIQGYVGWTTKKKFSAVKKILGDKVHIETARGTAFQNWAYCTKDGNFWCIWQETRARKA